MKSNFRQPKSTGFTIEVSRDYQRLDARMRKHCCFDLSAWTSQSAIEYLHELILGVVSA
jgi:hypothetical protein